MGPFFYNTNGFAFHRIDEAARIVADLGYDGIALTPDVHHLDPQCASAADVCAFGELLRDLDLDVVIETGARFVLDPARKHHPTLLDADDLAARRLAFLERCIDMARDLGARVVSLWSGAAPEGLPTAEAFQRLTAALSRLCEYAAQRDVRVGFEPEPGMAVQHMSAWPAVRDAVAHAALGLTLDVGHCLALREVDPAAAVREHAADLLVMHLDDHRGGVHDHLAFGDGDIDFGAIGEALRDTNYRGPLEVELSRHSATAPATARDALKFLRSAFGESRAV